MKILFINKLISEAGGIEYYINALAARLRKAKHDVFAVHDDERPEQERYDKCYRVAGLWDSAVEITQKNMEDIERILKDCTPDVIYLHKLDNGKAIDFISKKGKTIQYIHDYKGVDPDGKMLLYDPLEPNEYPLSPACFLRAFTRRSMPRDPVKGLRAYSRAKHMLGAIKNLEQVIVASSHMKNILIKNGVLPERIEVLPYFVDYKLPDYKSKLPEKRILFAGRIAPGKGVEDLIDVMTLVKNDFILDVAGTGPLEDICRRKAEQSGLKDKILFHGWVKHDELKKFYEASSFIVLPSIWPEPFGICGIEAAYYARPAVGFNVGGVSDWLIKGKTGFLIEPYNKPVMAEKIQYLLDNPEVNLELGMQARKRRKKGRMDIHKPPMEILHNSLSKDPHITSQYEEIGR